MILDSLENLEAYASLSPLFEKAIDYLKNTDLSALEVGKVKLQGEKYSMQILKGVNRVKTIEGTADIFILYISEWKKYVEKIKA